MKNGELFDTVIRILEGREEISENVRNSMLMATLVQLNKNLTAVSKIVGKLDGRLTAIEELRIKEAIISERNVTWPWIKDNILMPIIRTAITLLLGFIFLKVFGVAP